MTSADFLATMAASSAERAAAARARESVAELRARIRDLPSPPPLRLSPQGFDLIAELKLRSPALGQLRATAHDDLEARVLAYAGAGAAAVSVLTEPSRFDGSLQHLQSAAQTLTAVGVPAMRKDFLVDPYQIIEARAAGAGGVLLIVRMLSPAVLTQMIETALEQKLFILLETFDEREVAVAVAALDPYRQAFADAALLGVNCRDLVTLQVVPERLESMVSALPEDLPRVAESGLSAAADAARLAAAGYDLALVGSALMTGSDPRELGKHMLDAGREARGHCSRWARFAADAMAR